MSSLLEAVGGRYFEDCNETEALNLGNEQGRRPALAAYALYRDNAGRLWELSLELTGLSQPSSPPSCRRRSAPVAPRRAACR